MTDLEPVRQSRLKLMGKSPAHYLEGRDDDTSPFRKGTALHSLLLGDPTRIAVYEGKRDSRVKVYQEFLAKNEGREILNPREMAEVNGMRRSIERNPDAMRLLDGTVREQRIEWEYQGRACAGTPDVVHIDKRTGEKMLVELKSARTSQPERFKSQGHWLYYHVQLAWYSHGLERSMLYKPGPVTRHKIVVVESTAPYPVTIVNVRESKIKAGREQWKLWMATLLECERTGVFPPYTLGEVDWEDDEGDGLDWGTDEAAA